MILENNKIATYLRDFSIIYEEASKYGRMPIYEVHKKLYNEGKVKTSESNYKEMKSVVYMMLSANRLASFNDIIKPKHFIENKIPDFFFDNIFVNEEDRFKFKKTDILVYIRNAFCHNDKSLYNFFIDEDGKVKVHIMLRNTKATDGETKGTLCPFNVILDENQLACLNLVYHCSNYFSMGSLRFKDLDAINEKNALNKIDDSKLRFLIDNIYLTRDLYNPLNNNQKKYAVKKVFDTNNFDKNQVEDKYKTTIRKKLSQIQKNTVYKNTKKQLNRIKNIHVENILAHETEKALTFDSKIKRINVLIYILSLFDEEKSLDGNIINIWNEMLSSKSRDAILGYDLSKLETKEIAILEFFDFDDHNSLLKSLYMKYMLESIITDKELMIDGKTYDKDRIRNSFVHGKWYINDRDQFEIYDSNTKKEEDTYNYNYHKTVNVSDMTKCIDEYYEQLIKEKEQSNLIRTRKIR